MSWNAYEQRWQNGACHARWQAVCSLCNHPMVFYACAVVIRIKQPLTMDADLVKDKSCMAVMPAGCSNRPAKAVRQSRLVCGQSWTPLCAGVAGALAGNPFGVDRRAIAEDLGMVGGVCPNSMDAVSDRDYVCEARAYCCLDEYQYCRIIIISLLLLLQFYYNCIVISCLARLAPVISPNKMMNMYRVCVGRILYQHLQESACQKTLERMKVNSTSMHTNSVRVGVRLCAQALFFAALHLVHLSRWAEDLIIYSSGLFKFVQCSDAYATGAACLCTFWM